jgi:hypothetical protein
MAEADTIHREATTGLPLLSGSIARVMNLFFIRSGVIW